MSVLTIETVEVNLITQSAIALANMVFRVLLEIARERGLSSGYLADGREVVEKGLFTWLAEEALILVRFEVSFPESDKALEVFELGFEYVDDGSEDLIKPDIEHLRDFCRQLNSLPVGAEYEVKVSHEPWASEVEGWVPCTFKEVDVEREDVLGDFGYGAIGGHLTYQGSVW